MKRFLIFACMVAVGLGSSSDSQAQLLRRRSGCGTSSGCNVGASGCNLSSSSGCNVGASGCNLSSSSGCNISPGVTAAVAVPVQLPPTSPVPSANAGAVGGATVQRLFQEAAGRDGDQCVIERPAAGTAALPGLLDSAGSRVDARLAKSFCTPATGMERPTVNVAFPLSAMSAATIGASDLVGAFR